MPSLHASVSWKLMANQEGAKAFGVRAILEDDGHLHVW